MSTRATSAVDHRKTSQDAAVQMARRFEDGTRREREGRLGVAAVVVLQQPEHGQRCRKDKCGGRRTIQCQPILRNLNLAISIEFQPSSAICHVFWARRWCSLKPMGTGARRERDASSEGRRGCGRRRSRETPAMCASGRDTAEGGREARARGKKRRWRESTGLGRGRRWTRVEVCLVEKGSRSFFLAYS
ncbi:hypothetical protein SCHPADRAFT_750817 [Schizopora paradoxa]|uniref:Uncharacterized protein n=1 Tax=Schizopora paradoxa TaxID=27342 RepID=A0A0H2QYB5_9AGAM|nr:hypothetical protein SCHPADRAFT_750817 [Schizopora paradoxa]